ncbi:hypothetical protein LINGRAHAP2_LOCUS10070 [Linum grandiflorum]
MGGYSHPYLP